MATISAAPNPVFIPKGASDGETIITWSTETDATGRIWRSIDEGLGYSPDIIFAPLLDEPPLSDGTVTAHVAVGKTYLFKLKDDEEGLLASVVVTAQKTNFDPMVAGAFHDLEAITVPIQRIQNVAVDARPDSVRISFSTAVATVPVVEINRRSDFASDGLEYVNLPWGPLKNHHSFLFGPLPQDTDYFFRITAGGSGLHPDQKAAVSTGTFTTGRRFARVTVREVVAVHSGDAGDFLTNPESRAEWHLLFQVFDRGGGVPHIVRDFPEVGYTSVSEGAVLSFPFGTDGDPIPRAPRRLRIHGRVHESDSPDFPYPGAGLETQGLISGVMPETLVQWETEYGLWTEGVADIVLPDNEGTFSREVEIDSGSFDLQFILRVRIDGRVRRSRAELPFVVTPKKPALSLAQGAGAGQMMAHGSIRVVQMAHGADRQLYLRLMESDPEELRTARADAASWHWRRVVGELTGSVIALRSADGFIDFIASGQDGSVLHTAFSPEDSAREAPRWRKLGGRIAGAITAVRAADDKLHVLGLGRDGNLQHGVFTPRLDLREARWVDLGGRELREPISAVEAGEEIHVFATGHAGSVFHHRGRDSAEWASLGGQTFSAGLAAKTAHDGRTVVLFGFDMDRTVHCKIWNGRRWAPSQADWTKLGSVDELDQPPATEPSANKPPAKKRRTKSILRSKARRK